MPVSAVERRSEAGLRAPPPQRTCADTAHRRRAQCPRPRNPFAQSPRWTPQAAAGVPPDAPLQNNNTRKRTPVSVVIIMSVIQLSVCNVIPTFFSPALLRTTVRHAKSGSVPRAKTQTRRRAIREEEKNRFNEPTHGQAGLLQPTVHSNDGVDSSHSVVDAGGAIDQGWIDTFQSGTHRSHST